MSASLTSPAAHDARSFAFVVLGVVVLVVGTGMVHESSVGAAEMAAANDAATHADWPQAIEHARAAAEALAPWSPWPDRGMSLLDATALAALTRGDRSVALLAYGAMRSASIATRGAGVDRTAWRTRAEQGIARLTSSSSRSTQSVDAERQTSAALTAERLPSSLAATGLAASVWVVLGAVAYGLSAQSLSRRAAWLVQVAVVVGLVVYGIVFFER